VPVETPLKLFHSDAPRFIVSDNRPLKTGFAALPLPRSPLIPLGLVGVWHRLVFNISSDTVSHTLKAETEEVAQAWTEALQTVRSREQSGF